MSSISINAAIALETTLKQRVNELKSLRSEVSVKKETSFYGEPKSTTVVDPQFDVKKVDKKITQITNALFKLNSKIKEMNAITTFESDVDVDDLLSPLE